MRTISNIRLDGFLSFCPGSPQFELKRLNLLIGPNGAGKSNVIEAIELLKATPYDLASCIREGGGASEWLWKGTGSCPATAEVVIHEGTPTKRPIKYRLEFTESANRLEILDEAIEEVEPFHGNSDVYFYYRFQHGRPVIKVSSSEGQGRGRTRCLQR